MFSGQETVVIPHVASSSAHNPAPASWMEPKTAMTSPGTNQA
jgi:hypothetical protein